MPQGEVKEMNAQWEGRVHLYLY